ncbi:MAG: phosphoglucosamine mutase [Endomicrobiia bacterium]
MKNINGRLFGTDGIRGIFGEYPLNTEFIKIIGSYSAFVLKNVFGKDKIFIGWDTRESSPKIVELLKKTFLDFGYEVYLTNVFPTGGIAYLCKKYSCLGVVISASHNPYNFNGIKFISPFGTKISDQIEEKIEENIKRKTKIKKDNKKGNLIDYSTKAENEYIDFLLDIFGNNINNSFLSLVVDCANGAGCKIAKNIFPKLVKKCQFVNTSPNGKNINYRCGSTHPQYLKKKIKNNQIGILFDGDCDRVIFIDEKKNIRDGDYIIGILASEYKKNKNLKNSLVVVTTMSNLGLLKYLWSKNIKVIQCPVGDKYVSEYLKSYDGNLGGEQAGHIVLYDYLPTGDGFITTMEVLKILINNKKPLYKLCKIFDKYPQIIKNVETKDKPSIEEIFDKKFIKDLENKIQGRIVLRYSGTEPLFRIMVEGKNKSKIEDIAEVIKKQFLGFVNKKN